MQNNIYSNIFYILQVIVVAILFDVLILKDVNLIYENSVSFSEILGFLITIIVALYIAHVVEEGREHKKAIEIVLGDMIRSLISECDEIQSAAYENRLNYLQVASFPKKIYLFRKDILNIMQKANLVSHDVDLILNKFSRMPSMSKILNEITYKTNDSENYLEVIDNVCDISPARIGKIQKQLAMVKKNLYTLWVVINLK